MRLHRRPHAWLIVSLALLGGGGRALAQAPRPGAPAAQAGDTGTAAARAAHERGLAARARGDWPAAYAAFVEAWERKHHWEIAVNLGEAEMVLGKYEDAVEHLSFAAGEPGFQRRSPDLVDVERQQISAWLESARGKIEARRRAAAAVPAPAPEEGPPPASTAAPRTWLWIAGVGAGLSATGIVSGATALAMSGGKVGEVEASLRGLPGNPGDPASVRCAGAAAATCHANEDRLRSADSLRSAATALFVTAGAVALTATVLAVLWPDRKQGAPVLAPVVSGGGAGFSLAAAW